MSDMVCSGLWAENAKICGWVYDSGRSTNMGEPISVILPMHCWHEYAQDAIESVLAQTHGDFECLLVINGDDEALLSRQNELESWTSGSVCCIRRSRGSPTR